MTTPTADILQIPKLVSCHAARTPDAIAAVDGRVTLTYRDLNGRANLIARELQTRGVRPESIVAVCLERSAAMVVAELAILKAGGAFLPLDPASPSSRLQMQLNDAHVGIVIAGERTAHRLPQGRWEIISLDDEGKQHDSTLTDAANDVETPVTGDNLAYLIYTSGSTGEPKGVQVIHSGLSNLLKWHQHTFSVTSADRASLVASPAFDASVWELWPYVICGATLCIADDPTRNAADRFQTWLLAKKVTIAFAPTPMAEILMQMEWPASTALRFLLTGADTLHHHPPANLPFTVVNNYGPTECTVVTTSASLPRDANANGEPSIGKPITNTEVYILDENMRPVPEGSPGELYIGGMGVARGYLNRPELNDERFVADPFKAEPRSLLYKTGDRAAFLPDGNIKFLGRLDDQVKIRGFRIEPGEVRSTLDLHPDIERSVVVAREHAPGDKYLVAYFVPRTNTPTNQSLKEFLSSRLPEYMVPDVFCSLTAFPISSNGKIDKQALPPVRKEESLNEQTSDDRKAIEERITAMISGLLRQGPVGVNDNFFELGGNSLLGAQVIARVRSNFGVELSLRALFDNPTISELSGEIEQLLIARLEAMSDEEAQQLADG